MALASLGVLVFTWPFVRSPPLELAGAYVHMLAWWAIVIAAIAWTARTDRRGPGRRDA